MVFYKFVKRSVSYSVTAFILTRAQQLNVVKTEHIKAIREEKQENFVAYMTQIRSVDELKSQTDRRRSCLFTRVVHFPTFSFFLGFRGDSHASFYG